MSSTRAKLAAAAASVGVLVLGWQIGTAGGRTAAAATTTPATTTTGSTTSGTTSGTGTTSSSSSSTTTAAATGWKSGTYTGSTQTNRYGSITVTVTITNGKITDVSAQASAADSHSQRINSQAIPQLKSTVIAAQSADVSTVSGATYTSDSYLTSLQSALDQAKQS